MPHPFSNPQNRVVNGALWARCVEAKKVRNIYFHIWTKQNKKKCIKSLRLSVCTAVYIVKWNLSDTFIDSKVETRCIQINKNSKKKYFTDHKIWTQYILFRP